MPSNLTSELLKEVEEKKKAYLWSEAAQLMERAAAGIPKKDEQARFMESAAYCHSRASQQAGNSKLFTERRRAAVKDYMKASELYAQNGEESRGQEGQKLGKTELQKKQ